MAKELDDVQVPRRTLVRRAGSRPRQAVEKALRAIQGNFDHVDGVIQQVNEKHNNLDDNVQEAVQHFNDVVADLEQRVFDLENP